jgi:hypothetical protein
VLLANTDLLLARTHDASGRDLDGSGAIGRILQLRVVPEQQKALARSKLLNDFRLSTDVPVKADPGPVVVTRCSGSAACATDVTVFTLSKMSDLIRA